MKNIYILFTLLTFTTVAHADWHSDYWRDQHNQRIEQHNNQILDHLQKIERDRYLNRPY